MTFAPTDGDAAQQLQVTNLPFWPDLDVAEWRSAVRSPDTVTDQRALESLRSAMVAVNRDLDDWRRAREDEGAKKLADVDADQYGEVSELVWLYKRAVHSRAQALVVEIHAGVDTTEEGVERSSEYGTTYAGYMRESRSAVRRIRGEPQMTVELI